MLKMKLVGAIEGVSGSCTWLHHSESDTQFLVDCGMHQGDEREEWANRQDFPFQAKRLKYVLLTHAHIDHCGLLPRLVREGFTGLVYATRATRELTELMLLDAARISKMYTAKEVKQIRWSIVDDDLGFKWGRSIRLAEGIWMTYLRSSHILGACLIGIGWKVAGENRSICFSGDVGCQTDENAYLPLMKSGQNPFADTDYIVVESTYGGRVRAQEHKDSQLRLERLAEVIGHTLFIKGGKVLMPAFSLHRTQELLMDVLQWMTVGLSNGMQEPNPGRCRHDRPLTANVHAPLGHAVTRVYAEHLCSKSPNGKYKYLNTGLCESLAMQADAIQTMLQNLVEHGRVKAGDGCYLTMTKPKQPSSFDADIVIASSGMCENGPVISYLERWGNDPRNTIILTGYQSAGSKGAELVQRANQSGLPLESLFQAEVIDMSPYYSAHADQEMLLEFLFRTDGYGSETPATVFLNHGNPASKYALSDAIRRRAELAAPHDRKIADVRIADARWFDLNTGEPIDVNNEQDGMRREMEALRSQLRQMIEGRQAKVSSFTALEISSSPASDTA